MTKTRSLLSVFGIVLIIAVIFSVQTSFAMGLSGLSVTMTCINLSYGDFTIDANRDNTGNGREAYRITVTDGQGTILHLVENLAGLPLGTYPEGSATNAGFNQVATPLDNVRTYTWLSLAGNGLLDEVAYTTTNPDCTGGASTPTSSFTYVANFLAVDFTDTSTQTPTIWAWNFGDGFTSGLQNPSHTFAAAGSYNVCLTSSNAAGVGTTECQNITVSAAPAAPTSSFTYVATYLAVNFTDTSTQTPTGWAWNLGDGNTSTAQNPTHTFAAAGTYNVCLTASNGVGAGTQSCQNVTVAAQQSPTSSFTFAATFLAVDFTDTSTQTPTSWAWNFGDGNTSTAQNPTHTFAAAGTYNVCLTASNGVGTGTQSCQNVTVSAAPQAPTSSFTYVATYLAVDFTDTSSQTPTSWAWNFGDGNTSTVQNPTHTFAAAGTYNVCLTASNGVGAGTQSCQNVTVAPQPPTSSFTFAATFLAVDFTDTSTQTPTSWAWNFGDGNTSTAQNPTHTFAAAGTYNVCLTASNAGGPGTQSCQNVTVAPQPPTSSFTYVATYLAVDFTDTSTQTPTGWAWNFGDGNTSNAQNPTHTFAAAGTYNVCLTASNAGGPGTQSCQNVTVAPQPPTSSFTYVATYLAVDFTDTSTQTPTGWAWNFGDGNTSNAQNPTHTFAAAGTYNVCLTASNAGGPGIQSCQNVTVAPQPPTSSFTYVATYLAVDFTDTSTQTPTGWAWNFGDGNTSTVQNPTHTFAAAGTYNVCLTASNAGGPGIQSCQNVTVAAAPTAPTSSFTYIATFLAVDFTDTSTQTPTGWAWNFGDGNTDNVQNPTHTFAAAGTYNVCLTASNGVGTGTQSCQNITVAAAPAAPTSSFTYVATYLAVDFTDTSTQTPTGWAWDFGDGNNSNAQNPTHTFAVTGAYNVCLTASNIAGAGTQSCQSITVSAAPQPPTSSFGYAATNLTVSFTDSSTQTPTGWAWDFGDGNSSLVQNPVHTYAGEGIYTVCLIASNIAGAGTLTCQNVTVINGQSSGGPQPQGDQENHDRDGDGILKNSDNCPDIYNPGQENGWGSPMGDACDTDWYNMQGIGIAGFRQNSGLFHLHGNCQFLADGTPKCPEVAIFDPSTFTPGSMPVEVTTPYAGTWSVWVFYLYSIDGTDYYQVNVYTTNPPQPDTLIDDHLQIQVRSGSWKWVKREG